MLVQAAPLLLGAMVGALIGMVAWGFRRSRESDAAFSVKTRDDVLLGFLFFAGFVFSIFVLYLFLILLNR